MSGDSVRSMLPMHRQMMANMIAHMNRETSDMNMPVDAAWNALIDSLHADLATMPDRDSAELRALMPEHHRRGRGRNTACTSNHAGRSGPLCSFIRR